MKTILTWILLAIVSASSTAVAAETRSEDPPAPNTANANPHFRLAVFEIQPDKKVDLTAEALTDRVLAICATLDNVDLVDRSQLMRVADEQKISLSGLTDAGAGIKLGRFVAATHILVGRLSVIGQSQYLILKLVNVETTQQQVISVRVPLTQGEDKLFDSLREELASALKPASAADDSADAAEKLRKAAAWLSGKRVVIDITESHVNQPLTDPAAATTVFNMLDELGVDVTLPNNPPHGWKEAVLETGKYDDAEVDYLLEGEGVSSFAAELQGMTSCRARVELRLVPVPGRNVLATQQGVGAEVDLAEALAAKAALEEATREALSKLIAAAGKRIGFAD